MIRRALVVALLAAFTGAAPAAAARERWDTRLLARVSLPGFPAHAYVHPNGRIYEGTYVNSSSRTPSRVLEYDGDGTLLRSWTVSGQELHGEQGVQVATSDARRRLVLLDHSPPRVLLLDRTTGDQLTYATFPAGAIPNYGAWGPDGSLYVTDYGQNVVWRVPPGGGVPDVWLRDARFATIEFGMTGLALAADRGTLLIGQQTAPAFGNLLTGGIFAVEIGADGRAGGARRVWQSGLADLTDGFAIAQSGRIYVAALGPNQIVVVDPTGREVERFPTLPLLGDNGSGTPFDALSSVAFLGTRLITASQSNPAANPDNWAIHDVEAGEPGLAEHIPANAGGALPAIALNVSPRRVRAGARMRFTFSATAAGVPLRGALIRFAGRSARTGGGGRAGITARLRRRGTARVIATRRGYLRAAATVTVTR